MKKIRDNHGVTLISLVVTIVIMMILTISLTASMTSTIELKKYNKIKEDIIALTEEVKVYYLKNEKLPIYTSKTIDIPNIVYEKDRNPNDSGNYYPINISALSKDLELNVGEGNKKQDFTTDDLYVVNEKSLTVYYVQGAVLDGKKHYTIVDDFTGGSFAEEYYSKVDLPIISVVTMESDGIEKTKAGIGDTVTLKMLSNYEFTTTPTVTINNEAVNTTWNGNVGIATYTLPETYDVELYNTKIPFSISNYSADNRIGEEITDVTFGQGVYSYGKVITVYGVPIPKEFYYVGGTKNSGLVISDDQEDKERYKGQETVGTDLKGNQFVWIPVENYEDFHLIEGYANNSIQKFLSSETSISKEAGSSTLSGTPLAKNNVAGTDESIAMYKSVKDNKGFYIARYEAGINGTIDNYDSGSATLSDGSVAPLSKKGVGVWNSIVWGSPDESTGLDDLYGSDLADGAVKVARSMYPNTSKLMYYGLPTNLTNNTGVISTLCYGVQWDAMMQFIDSNYVTETCTEDSLARNATGEWTEEVSEYELHTTGYHSIKNIYDIGGNVSEWTMEGTSGNGRIHRGGEAFNSASMYTTSTRAIYNPGDKYYTIGFRVAIYFK